VVTRRLLVSLSAARPTCVYNSYSLPGGSFARRAVLERRGVRPSRGQRSMLGRTCSLPRPTSARGRSRRPNSLNLLLRLARVPPTMLSGMKSAWASACARSVRSANSFLSGRVAPAPQMELLFISGLLALRDGVGRPVVAFVCGLGLAHTTRDPMLNLLVVCDHRVHFCSGCPCVRVRSCAVYAGPRFARSAFPGFPVL
jgi:hypothetical protein